MCIFSNYLYVCIHLIAACQKGSFYYFFCNPNCIYAGENNAHFFPISGKVQPLFNDKAHAMGTCYLLQYSYYKN